MVREVSFEVVGNKAMKDRMRRIARDQKVRIERALRTEAELIMTESKQKFVPVDDNFLRSSGHVQPAKTEGRETSVVMAYGGVSAPYALAVHEHPSRHSPRSWQGKRIQDILSVRGRVPWNVQEGKGPKYLDRPMKRKIRSGELEDNLAKRLSLDGGGSS